MEFANPHPNVTVRRCSHCRNEGHRINVCPEAFTDGWSIYNTILTIIQTNFQRPENIEPTVYMFMNSLNVSKLRLLTYYHNAHNELNNFASILYHNYLINSRESGLYTKSHMLKVLGLYYKQIYARSLAEFVERPELLIQFQAPLQRRMYGEEFLEPHRTITTTKKFTFEIQVDNNNNNINNNNTSISRSTFDCPICMDEIEDKNRITYNCNHDVCHSCFDKYLTNFINSNNNNNNNNNKSPCCCLCRANVTSLTCIDNECSNAIKEKFINE